MGTGVRATIAYLARAPVSKKQNKERNTKMNKYNEVDVDHGGLFAAFIITNINGKWLYYTAVASLNELEEIADLLERRMDEIAECYG